MTSAILAVETSCDETAAAVLAGDGTVLASEIASQAPIHARHGGVVPEVASRSHLTALRPILERVTQAAGLTMEDIGGFAATIGPGLATSLMIGASVAKGLAIATGKPFFAVNHLEGHLLSPFFGRPAGVQPCVGLIVSGGHTMLVEILRPGEYRLLGKTLDDAAGEAFDKVGKLFGLSYPGGPEIDRLARSGNPNRYPFPRSMLHKNDFDFSFSGMKTAARYLLPKLEKPELEDLCASFQEAMVDVLVRKTFDASEAAGKRLIAVSGGVSCNSRLRARFEVESARRGITVLFAERMLSTDNAVMIASVALQRLLAGQDSPITCDIDPASSLAFS